MGDPFVDAGVAVLEHRLEKPCDAFTLSDLSKQADELETLYTENKAWVAYLTVHFQNSCWCNPSMAPETKTAERKLLLRSFDARAIPRRSCVYCQRPAQHRPNGSIIPLTTGKGVMTCGSGGEPGVPVCSACQFAIQFYPLATVKVQGDPLFWWTPHHEWMYALTADFFDRARRLIEGSPEGVPNVPAPFTRLMDSVEAVLRIHPDLPAQDLFGCHSTNLRKAPNYLEIRIHRGLIEFIRYGQGHPVYRAIREDGWKSEVPKSKKRVAAEETPREMRRNKFYEDLGKFLRDADARDTGIIRRYFTKHARGSNGTFELAAVFARKVLGMTQEQIDAIKELADQMGRLSEGAGLSALALSKPNANQLLGQHQGYQQPNGSGRRGSDPFRLCVEGV